jgi:hypothetical protein
MGWTHYEHGPGCECDECGRAYRVSDEKAIRVMEKWKSRLESPPPQWWEWAVAAAQYHLPTCDWVKTGVSTNHCSCALTRVIAKIIEEATRT